MKKFSLILPPACEPDPLKVGKGLVTFLHTFCGYMNRAIVMLEHSKLYMHCQAIKQHVGGGLFHFSTRCERKGKNLWVVGVDPYEKAKNDGHSLAPQYYTQCICCVLQVYTSGVYVDICTIVHVRTSFQTFKLLNFMCICTFS